MSTTLAFGASEASSGAGLRVALGSTGRRNPANLRPSANTPVNAVGSTVEYTSPFSGARTYVGSAWSSSMAAIPSRIVGGYVSISACANDSTGSSRTTPSVFTQLLGYPPNEHGYSSPSDAFA